VLLASAASTVVLVSHDPASQFALVTWLTALGSVVALSGALPSTQGAPLLDDRDANVYGPGRPRLRPGIEAALVIGILVVATSLRVVNLEDLPGIFGDEGERGLVAQAINHGDRVPLFADNWAGVPNVYFHLLAFMLRYFGDTMQGARLLSVISGVVVVFLVYI